jgi:Fe2+ or Zn2+ uptake regulation protein
MTSPTQIQQLRAQGFRLTPQRLAVLRVIESSGRHMPAVEIVQQTREIMPGITEASVYRILDFLTSAGLVLAAHVGSGQLVYETAARAHHHLICRSCGQSCDVDYSMLESLYKELQACTGYQVDSVHVTLFGLCPECQDHQHQGG